MKSRHGASLSCSVIRIIEREEEHQRTMDSSEGDNSGDRTGRMKAAVQEIMDGIRSENLDRKIDAAREIRRLTKTSTRHRRRLSSAVEPLVDMLREGGAECVEAAMLALVNLAVKDERNKIKIVQSGALGTLICFLRSTDLTLQEYSAAAVLTLTASPTNKPIISHSGAVPFLVNILRNGNQQAKVDSLMALYNLSTIPDSVTTILALHPIPILVDILKTYHKSSKAIEKCSAIMESLLIFDEARTALAATEGGVLALVEVVEEGSIQSREHAVAALVNLCEGDRCKYRVIILNEGVIPGLLELTVQGTPKSQLKARKLLELLRSSPCPRTEFQPDTMKSIVCNIVSKVDGGEHAEKAKKLLVEMVQVSMEQSLKHLQQRAFSLSSCPF